MDTGPDEKTRIISVNGEKLHYAIVDLAVQTEPGCLMDFEVEALALITNEKRKIEYQSLRFLKNRFFKGSPIEYLPNGKPYLPGFHDNIGISHSKKHVVFAFSKVLFGCDIEEKDPRLFSVEARFTGPSETSRLEPFSPLDRLCILWTCKEAIFKLVGVMGIRWKEQCTLLHVDAPILTFQLALQDRIILVKCYIEKASPSTWFSLAFHQNHE